MAGDRPRVYPSVTSVAVDQSESAKHVTTTPSNKDGYHGREGHRGCTRVPVYLGHGIQRI